MPGAVTTNLIKDLRDATGVSVMQCKNALEEAGGDMEKALSILKRVSADIALKKAGRDAKDGRVSVKSDGKKSVLVALHCETDFVAKNEDFVKLLASLSDIAFEEGPEKMKEKAEDMINPVIQKTGEKIELGDVYEVKGEILGSYVHNDKSAVIVSLSGGSAELAKDIAMHITAMKPEFFSREEITEEARKAANQMFSKEVEESGKPEDIKKKILEGKVSSYFKEKTLPDQAFIKDPDTTIEKLLSDNKAKVREVKRYTI